MSKTNAQICLACGGPLDAPVQGGKIKCTFCGTVNIVEAHETRKGNETICPACGATNPKDAQHCGRCGVKLEFNCPKCAALNSYGTIYCISCGVDIQAEIKRQQDERKRQEAEALRQQELIRQQVAKEKRKKQISALVTGGIMLVIGFCIVVVVGFVIYDNTLSPSARSTQTAISSAQTATTRHSILFQDNFSNPNSGWGNYTSDNGSTDYKNDGYLIHVIPKSWMIWDILPNTFQDDVRIEVDISKVDGPENNAFGVICRHQDDDNFYFLAVTSDGYAVIEKMLNGNFVIISSTSDKWTSVSGINPGSGTNHLRADCIGDKLTLYANGSQVVMAVDNSFTGGGIGLLAGTFDEGELDVLFDNFYVYRP